MVEMCNDWNAASKSGKGEGKPHNVGFLQVTYWISFMHAALAYSFFLLSFLIFWRSTQCLQSFFPLHRYVFLWVMFMSFLYRVSWWWAWIAKEQMIPFAAFRLRTDIIIITIILMEEIRYNYYMLVSMRVASVFIKARSSNAYNVKLDRVFERVRVPRFLSPFY